jgi:hypothetical protein
MSVFDNRDAPPPPSYPIYFLFRFFFLPGAWCVMRGAWCAVRGARCVVRGAWCLVRGAWCSTEKKNKIQQMI